MYIRISISAQSWLSVPPAPGLIFIMAFSLSSGAESIFKNSRSLIFASAFLNCASISCWVASPASRNSSITFRSFSSSSARAKASVQRFFSLICFNNCSAFLGSSQKLVAWVFSSSSLIFFTFPSMSKKPPQGLQPFRQVLYSFWCVHARFDFGAKIVIFSCGWQGTQYGLTDFMFSLVKEIIRHFLSGLYQ